MSSFLATDIQGELARQVVNILGLLILAFVGWAARRVYKGFEGFHARLDHLDKCIDALRDENQISDLQIQKELAYLKALVGVPLEKKIE